MNKDSPRNGTITFVLDFFNKQDLRPYTVSDTTCIIQGTAAKGTSTIKTQVKEMEMNAVFLV